MSRLLYQVGINAYSLLLHGLAPFHAKAKKMIVGRRGIFSEIEKKLAQNNQPVIWFHCASLGEFEQGRPVLEKITAEYPLYKIVLTFFSSSGYEVRKNYHGADYIFYLPLDSPANARKFLDLIKPTLAFFVKYEFWYNYLHELKQRQIPTFSISAIFRSDQLFFKSYGSFYRNLLHSFTHIFTQNQTSANLLASAGIKPITVAGDTRFDRVLQTAASVKNLPLVQAFKKNKPIFIIGSSWPQDLEALLPFIQKWADQVKFIIAPHEIHEKEITALEEQLSGRAIRFSQADKQNPENFSVLIIDNIGMLGSLYAYGDYAYIGGAFGKGLHNTLEAAVFGLPLFFGPNYQKFQEAIDLVALGVAHPIRTTRELDVAFPRIFTDSTLYQTLATASGNYVKNQAGATDIIIKHVQPWLQQVQKA